MSNLIEFERLQVLKSGLDLNVFVTTNKSSIICIVTSMTLGQIIDGGFVQP